MIKPGPAKAHRFARIEIGRDGKQLMLQFAKIVSAPRLVKYFAQKFADGVIIKNTGRQRFAENAKTSHQATRQGP